MSLYAVPHPEVDETLYVQECVARVGCPACKVKAGMPCPETDAGCADGSEVLS